ncbi:protein of unknown function [Enterobacter cancerogenus]|nr:protein of unknown function [Enterobacter cancerogenus]
MPFHGFSRLYSPKPNSWVEKGFNTQIFLMIKSRLIQRVYCVQLNAP